MGELHFLDCRVGEDAILPEAAALSAALQCLNEAKEVI